MAQKGVSRIKGRLAYFFEYIFVKQRMRSFSIKLQYDRSEFEVDVNVMRQNDCIQYTIILKDLELEYLFGTQVIHEEPTKGFKAGDNQDQRYFNAITDALISSDQRLLALARA